MYGKIYEQTFRGSMYGSGSCIFAVWSYVIAHTKPDAMVELNPQELASMIGEDQSRIQEAIEHFQSPDPRSRSKEFEGRRLIQKGEFIYFVPQYHKYHGFANDRERREYFAQKKREQRQRDRDRQTVKSKESKDVTQSEAESGSKTEAKQECAVRLVEQVAIRFNEWVRFRKGLGKKPKDWDSMFRKQIEWLLQFSEQDQIAIIDQSIRNGWQGLFELKRNSGNGQRQMSAFEIEKRCSAISEEISNTFKRNGNKRVEGDGIDALKQRRDELKKQMVA